MGDKDHRDGRYCTAAGFLPYLDDVGEPYSTGERVSVVDDRLPVVAVPAVQLHAPAALAKVVDIPEGQKHTSTDDAGEPARLTVRGR